MGVRAGNGRANRRWGFRAALLGALLLLSCPADLDARRDGQEIVYEFLDQGDLESADLLLKDCWPVERFEPVCFDGLPEWDEDPYDENYWRMIFYGLRPLSHLVWAYEQTGDPAYANKLAEILRDFVEVYPDRSPNWDEHTAAFRAMVLVNTYFKLERWGMLDEDLADELETMIRGHARYLYQPANYESDYNHGFTEAAALLLIAENFPENVGGGTGCAPSWSARARTRLERLMDEVVGDDGVEVEQSPYYHFYVMNFAWQIDRWAQLYDVPLSGGFHERFESMIPYATHIPTPDGHVPLIGSSVAKNVRADSLGLLPQMGEVYPDLQYVLTAGEEGTEPQDLAVLFPTCGQFVARSGFGPPEEFDQQTHLVFDVGTYYGDHSHRDALSLHLYARGRTLLPDSGLYSYEPGELQEYFQGTRAHSTVVVDGKDQRASSATALTTAVGDGWAYQSGFHRLYDGVRHDRGVLLLGDDTVLVIDTLDAVRSRRFAQTWHLFPEATVEIDGEVVTAYDEEGEPLLSIVQAGVTGEVASLYGVEDPLQGWYSATYEEAVPNPVVEYVVEAKQALFVTLLAIGEPVEGEAEATVEEIGGTLSIDLSLGGRDARIDITDPFGEEEDVDVRAWR